MNIHHHQGFINRSFRNSLLAVAILMLSNLSAFAQSNRQVSGTIRDDSGRSVSGVSIKLVSEKDSVHTSSDDGGFYNFKGLRGNNFRMTLSSLGFDTLMHAFVFEAERNQLLLAPLVMKESSRLLDEVGITAKIDIQVKEDTLEYNTKNLKLREGSLVEDALKRLDGIDVDRDGNVTAQGEAVTRVRINGKDFFGGDVQTATKNLPANIIERIQIVDDYGDMANITGNRTGDPERILNIQIDPSHNRGAMGNYRIGGGTDNRYQATGMIGIMRESIQFTALGNLNNVNASLFDFSTRGGGRRGGGRGSFGRGFGGGGRGFGGGASGLTNTNSIGMNYRHDISPKLTMYGNYSFSHDKNRTLSYNVNDYFNEQLMEILDNQSGSISNSHRFDWNIEYSPTDKDYFKVTPSFSLGSTEGDGLLDANNTLRGNLVNTMMTTSLSDNFAPNYGVSALYNRRLSESGRNLFVDFSFNTATTEQDEERIQETLLADPNMDTEAFIRTIADQRNKNLSGGASLSYTEPLGEFTSLEFNYDYNFRTYDNRRFDNALDRQGEQIVDDEIFIGNRIFDYSFTTHRVGANYRYRTDKIVYSIGASLEPNQLRGDATVQDQVIPVSRRGLNFAPIASFEYKFSRTKSFSVRYTGRANEPGFSQLQPYTDYSNRNNLVTGNPNLDAEFSHELRVNFRNFNVGSGQSWFAGVSGSVSEDRVVANRTIRVDPELGVVQETSYLNTDGFYNMRGYYHYSIPFAERVYVVSFNGFAGYNNNISFTDNVRNIGKNWNLSQGVNFRYIPSESIEVSPGVQYSYNTTANTAGRAGINNDVSTWALTFGSTINLSPTWVISADMAKTTNNGYSSAIGANPFIINAYIEKQFLKGRNGAIRFQAFDLLNEQTNVFRNVSDNLISDSRTNRLGQYFMLSLSYRFQNFAGGEMGGFDGMGRPGGGRHSRGGGMF